MDPETPKYTKFIFGPCQIIIIKKQKKVINKIAILFKLNFLIKENIHKNLRN